MADIKVVQHNPHQRRYGPRLPESEWDRFRPILEDLHAQGISAQEIVRRAKADHGFRGTYSAMYTRFRKWGLTTPRSDLLVNGVSVILSPLNEIPGNEDEATLQVAANESNPGIAMDVDTHPTTANSSHFDAESSSDEDQMRLTSDTKLSLDSSQDASTSAGSTLEPTNAAPTTIEHSISNHKHDVVVQDLEAHLPNLALSDNNSVTQIPKRSRSQVSSMRSSWSSDTRSFVYHAKRLRHLSSVNSLTSSLKRLSAGSSRKSLSFGVVTGYGPDLDTVFEIPTNESDKPLVPEISSKMRQRLRKFTSQTKSSAPQGIKNSWADISEEENVHSYELSWADIENVNAHLRMSSLGITPVWRLHSDVKSLPAVDANTLAEFSSRCPLYRGVVIAHDPNPKRRYLIIGQNHIHALSDEVPLLSVQAEQIATQQQELQALIMRSLYRTIILWMWGWMLK